MSFSTSPADVVSASDGPRTIGAHSELPVKELHPCDTEPVGIVAVVFLAIAVGVAGWILVGSILDHRRAPQIAADQGWTFEAKGNLPSGASEFGVLPRRERRVLWKMSPPETTDVVFRLDTRSEKLGTGYFGYGKPWVRIACALVDQPHESLTCSLVRLPTGQTKPGVGGGDEQSREQTHWLSRFGLTGPEAEPSALLGPEFQRLLLARPNRGDRFEVHIRPRQLLVTANAVNPRGQPDLLKLAQQLRDALSERS